MDEDMGEIAYRDELEEPHELEHDYDAYHQIYYEQQDGKSVWENGWFFESKWY